MEAPGRMPQFMAHNIGLIVTPYVQRENSEDDRVLAGATELSSGVKVIWNYWTFVSNRMLDNYV